MLEDRDGAVAVDRHQEGDPGDRHQQERADHRRSLVKDRQGLGGGHGDGAVVGEPADRDQHRQEAAHDGAPTPEHHPGLDDLGRPRADAGDAEQPQKGGASDGPGDQHQRRIPEAQPRRGDQEGAGEEREEVRECSCPDEEELPGTPVTAVWGYRLQPPELDPEELVVRSQDLRGWPQPSDLQSDRWTRLSHSLVPLNRARPEGVRQVEASRRWY